MTTTDIRSKLQHFIEKMDDERAAEIYSMFEEEIEVDEARRKLIEAERHKYFVEGGRSYSWEEVKQMAINKERRNELRN